MESYILEIILQYKQLLILFSGSLFRLNKFLIITDFVLEGFNVITKSKILIFATHSTIPSFTANSVNVMKMSEALAEEGYQVLLLARDGDKFIDNNDLCNASVFSYYFVAKIFNIKLCKIKNEIIYLIWLISYILYRRPSIVYTRVPYIAIATCIFRIKTILHCHSPIYKQNGIKDIISHLTKKYIKLLPKSRYLIKFALVSEGLKKLYESEYFIDSPKLQVISNGVDLKRFEPTLSKEDARLKVNLPLDAKIITYSGQFYEGRGVDFVIRLAGILKEYYFIIVGGQPEEIKEMQKQATHNVYFIGHIPNGIVPIYLFSADILLLPYQHSLKVFGGNVQSGDVIRPLKLFEYMASNRPIVASDLPGLREVLDCNNSILVSPENISEWIEAINILFNNPDMRNSLSAKAFEDVKQFTCRKIAARIMN